MKTTNIGLVMLTALVVTKYLVTQGVVTGIAGSFQSEFAINPSTVLDFVAANKQTVQPELLAYSPSISETHLIVRTKSNRSTNRSGNDKVLAANDYSKTTPGFTNDIEQTLPMEHSNSLVVFDPTSPAITDIKTQFVDQYDNAAPLDNGNTVVNEMLMMMPRR